LATDDEEGANPIIMKLYEKLHGFNRETPLTKKKSLNFTD